MPLIEIRKSNVLGFNIASCVNDDKSFVWNSDWDDNFPEKDGLTKGKWYLIEVEQYFESGIHVGNYIYEVRVNKQIVVQTELDKLCCSYYSLKFI